MSSQQLRIIPSSDAIDPALIPQRILANGASMPAIGLGTFGSDHVSHETVADVVLDAISLGYRHIDCAAVYGNEEEIGKRFESLFSVGFKRGELWITSKVWNDSHDDVIGSCQRSLNALHLEYLDLFLVHWPFPNHHPPGCDVSVRNPNAVPYRHENYMRTWRQMEELVNRGMVREIGTSNMTIPKMDLLLRDARIRPVVNEMELHPHFQQPEFFAYLKARGIEPIGFSPIGSPAKPERDRTPEDTIGTWSYFIQYVQDYSHQPEKVAGHLLTGTLVGFALGRFVASALMDRMSAGRLMGIFSLINIMLVAVGILFPGWLGIGAIFITSFFMSLMFPTIFALGLNGLGKSTKSGSSALVMAIVGGAIYTPLIGLISQRAHSMAAAMIVPLLCYIVVALYGFWGCHLKPRFCAE